MKVDSCSACGGVLGPDDDRCRLCGLTRGADAFESDAPVGIGTTPAAPETTVAEPFSAAEVNCAACGAASPSYARYCWKCGERLVDDASFEDEDRGAVRPPAPVEPARPSADVDHAGRHALLLVAAAAAFVILLFAVTQISGRSDPLRPPPQTANLDVPETLIPPQIQGEVRDIEARIAAAGDDADRLALQEQLVELYISAGAFARAGDLQEVIAREIETVDAWAEAGSFFLAHVLRTESPEQVIFAERSARAFERALALRPGDLDIKTDLATAYRYHPDDPMRAVTLIQEVLEEDENHPRARFNYGVMLAEIGRGEQARAQFERIVETPDADEFVKDRAREMLQNMVPS